MPKVHSPSCLAPTAPRAASLLAFHLNCVSSCSAIYSVIVSRMHLASLISEIKALQTLLCGTNFGVPHRSAGPRSRNACHRKMLISISVHKAVWQPQHSQLQIISWLRLQATAYLLSRIQKQLIGHNEMQSECSCPISSVPHRPSSSAALQ